MTYAEAVAAVGVKKNAGGSTVIVGQGGNPAEKPYSPSAEDSATNDWTSN